jgi:hypothetical protein
MQTRLSLEQCRKLIQDQDSDALTDEQILGMRDMLYTLADVVTDAFSDLGEIDPGLFDPPGTISQQLERIEVEGLRRMGVERS